MYKYTPKEITQHYWDKGYLPEDCRSSVKAWIEDYQKGGRTFKERRDFPLSERFSNTP